MVYQVSSGSLNEEQIVETESASEALELAKSALKNGGGYMVVTLIEGGSDAIELLKVLADQEVD